MRRSSKMLLLLCLVAVVIILAVYDNQQHYLLTMQDYDVRVINGFTNNSSLPLVIWCSSGGDDLGGRALQEGDDFSWSTRSNYFWGTNGFLCTMKWDEKRKKFDAFKVPRDIQRCSLTRKCSWLVTEDGFYFSSDEVNWNKDFSWS
ncbi:S-protein homolog 24 [Linum perenne]